MDTHTFRELRDRRNTIGAQSAGNTTDVADHGTEEDLFGCLPSDQALEAAASSDRVAPTVFFVSYCFGCGV